ncbi:MAG: hypothetical protein AAF438_16415 [Pseudomonadota bacterium]
MLLLMQRFARRLRPLKNVFLILILLSFIAFAMNVLAVEPLGEDKFLIPILVGLLWSLFLYSFIGLFQEIPGPSKEKLGFFGRIKVKIKLGLYWLLGCVSILISIAVLVVSFRLISVWD